MEVANIGADNDAQKNAVNESQLVALLKKKDNDAFKELVESMQGMVFNTALGILQDAQDAEDIAQEVFIKVLDAIHGFKEDSKLSTWVYRITVSKSLDLIRKRKRKKRFAFLQSLYSPHDESQIIDPPDFFHPGIKMENQETGSILFKAIQRLPENQKAAFILNKTENLSYGEIAQIMQLSESAVDALLQRAKQNLRKQLREYYTNYDS